LKPFLISRRFQQSKYPEKRTANLNDPQFAEFLSGPGDLSGLLKASSDLTQMFKDA